MQYLTDNAEASVCIFVELQTLAQRDFKKKSTHFKWDPRQFLFTIALQQ